ncbi:MULTISPECIES: AzlD domain-containing protein [unclassified Pseudactinotalea]|uniref:AzlD domain-containing protein n=1 Tax=Micrococcales TaxID=85006 RepID=UPI003C7C9244
MSALWIATIVAAVGCYLLKLAGTAMPETVLEHPLVQAISRYLPVAMLSALIVTELAAGDRSFDVDWRVLAGVGAAMIALLLRFGFLVAFAVAIIVTALLRLVT